MMLKKIFIAALTVLAVFGVQAASAQYFTTVSVTGSVYDAVSHEPVSVFLIVLDENGKRVSAARSNAADGGYYFIAGLKPGHKYTINIGQKGYFKEQIPIEVPNTDRYEEISRDFLIKPKEEGVQIPIPVPPFELNKSKLRVGADAILDNMAETLKYNPDVKFEIQCYPDDAEDKEANRQLTKQRCESLKQYFTEQGLKESRISVSSSASVDPNNPPPTEKRAKGKRYVGPSYIVVKDF